MSEIVEPTTTDMATADRTVRIGVVQMWTVPGDDAHNMAAARRHVETLAEQGADLVVLPELFATGYDLTRDLEAEAQPIDGPHVRELVHLAARHSLVIVTALMVTDPDDGLLDVALVIDATGVRATAAKQFLWGDEVRVFGRRPEPWALAKTSAGTIGVSICYEAGFPESVRDLASRGAEIVAVPAAFGRPRLHAWDLLTRSRALENGVFVAAAGLTGDNGQGVVFAGHSRVVGPDGSILAGLADAEGEVLAVVDLGAVDAARTAIPYLVDLSGRPADVVRSDDSIDHQGEISV